MRDTERIGHIIQAIRELERAKDVYSYDTMVSDRFIFFAYVKQVEIIGEATYMLTKEFREDHPDIEWDQMEKMRHVLVHGYYNIDPAQLWETIVNDIPPLKTKIEALLVHSQSPITHED